MFRMSAVVGMCLLMLALLVGVAETQGTKKEGKAKGQLPQNWKNLNLTPTQIEQIYTVQTDYKAKIAELTKQVKELVAKEKSEMAKILTDEQRAKLIELTTGTKIEKTVKTEEKKTVKTEEKKTEDKK